MYSSTWQRHFIRIHGARSREFHRNYTPLVSSQFPFPACSINRGRELIRTYRGRGGSCRNCREESRAETVAKKAESKYKCRDTKIGKPTCNHRHFVLRIVLAIERPYPQTTRNVNAVTRTNRQVQLHVIPNASREVSAPRLC